MAGKKKEEFSPEEGRKLIEEEKKAKRERAKNLGDKAYDPKRDRSKFKVKYNAHSDPEDLWNGG
jgi:hypothetical protein